MTQDRVQIGAEVDKQEYANFKKWVRSMHGSVRGNLGSELEKAMKAHRSERDVSTRLDRIEDDLATIRDALTDLDGGGGVDVSPEKVRARAKPAPNQPRKDKIEWVIAEVKRRSDNQAYSRPAIGSIIEEEYGFEDDRVESYVEDVIEALGAEPVPDDPYTVRWGDAIEVAEADAAEARAEEADSFFDDLDAADREA